MNLTVIDDNLADEAASVSTHSRRATNFRLTKQHLCYTMISSTIYLIKVRPFRLRRDGKKMQTRPRGYSGKSESTYRLVAEHRPQ
jgi:hypothetical protein